ncbi:MAG TPA: nicotinate-nucleotide adenylyltransferase [Deinococcales bacterium]|nr:nicotinate-nucleotide adenylyltransferase [Deinococcales bacterium]
MKLGLLGGAFDPIHWGHVGAALESAYQLNLDEVWLVPGADPPFKTPAATAEQRLAMTALAAREGPRLVPSRLELDLPQPSYTVNTLRHLAQARPGDELYFIVGTDAAASLSAWREPRAIRALARLVVVERAGWTPAPAAGSAPVAAEGGPPAPAGGSVPRVEDAGSRADYNARADLALPGGPPDAVVRWPGVAVSSSELRHRLKTGAPIEYLLPRSVADYIREHGLYR